MGLNTESYILSKKYISDTADSLGAIKGANCTIKNIENIVKDGLSGKAITFEWISNSGIKQTQSITVFDGVNGINGKDGVDGRDGVMTFADLTQEERESLKGEKGDKGDTGEKGDKGDSILVLGEEITPTNGVVSLMMEPNKTYIINKAISMLNLSAPHTYNSYDEFYVMFTTSADGCTVIKPDDWIYLTGSTESFKPNTFYEFDVINDKIICPNGTAVV